MRNLNLRTWAQSILLAALLLLSAACRANEFQVPPNTADGWQVGTLDEVGLDEKPIAQALQRIDSGRYADVHSLLIVKDGLLVVEEYFPGHAWRYDAEHFQGPYTEFDRDTLHTIMSVTKAFTSAVVGIAVEQEAIGSEQDPVFDYFPEYQQLRTPQKEALTVEHLLTMTSGLQWNEWEYPLSDTRNDLIQLWIVDDPVHYILDKPLVREPGSSWYYSGGDVILLGEIIQESTGQLISQYAAEQFFEPLGITEYEWHFIDPDTVHASGDLMLRPRDMAKLGYVLLNHGQWQEEQILSPDWVEKTTSSYIDTPAPGNGEEYGYQWWHMTFPSEAGPVETLHRSGWGGQDLYLFPDLDLLVAMTGGNYEEQSPNNDIVTQHIIPAVQALNIP
jgi:CubicO group peptidase (beta-lactamase class C family)